MKYCVATVKGGSCKSTTVGYLGEGLSRLGRRVVVVDADPQGTLLEWQEAAGEAGEPLSPEVVGMPSGVMIRRQLGGLNAKFDDVIIDCPNRDSGIIEAALAAADFAIIPMVPGVEEMRRAHLALQMASRAGVPARILLVRVDVRTNLYQEVLGVLDAGEVPRFRSVIRTRADIAATVGAKRPDQLHDYADLATEVQEVTLVVHA
jgi:chromosome partitioning protein